MHVCMYVRCVVSIFHAYCVFNQCMYVVAFFYCGCLDTYLELDEEIHFFLVFCSFAVFMHIRMHVV